MFLCLLCVVMAAVAPPTKAKGPERSAFFIVTADWSQLENADVDLWSRSPDGALVYFKTRQAGCASLDRDSRGFIDSHIKLADGSEVKVSSYKETISIACIAPGQWDVAVNLFAYHGKTDASGVYIETSAEDAARGVELPVHVEVLRINPALKVEWSGDIVLNHARETRNVVSFNLAPDGSLKLVDTPVTPIDEDGK